MATQNSGSKEQKTWVSPRAKPSYFLGAPDPQEKPRFCRDTFFGLPRLADLQRDRSDLLDDHLVSIVPVPFDSGSSYGNGSRFGWRGIRDASTRYRTVNQDVAFGAAEVAQARDLCDYIQIAQADPISCTPFNIGLAVDQMKAGFGKILNLGGRILAVGGDHTIVYPLLAAEYQKFGKVAVIHFDSHYDTFPGYFGQDVTHGTPFRNAYEEDLIDPSKSVHIGIHGPIGALTDQTDDQEMGFTTIASREIFDHNLGAIVQKTRDVVGDMPVHVSVDIDVLDPGVAPKTGTPEPGGLSAKQLQELILGLSGLNIVGADIVEVSSDSGQEPTAVAGAGVAFNLLTLMSMRICAQK